MLSCSVTSDSAATWTAAHHASLSMEFSRQEYWSGLPFPSPVHHCRHILYHLSHLGCIQINEEEFIFITIIPSREGMCMISRFSCVRLFATPWTVALQAPLSMGFSRQEYWSALSLPSSINVTTRK